MTDALWEEPNRRIQRGRPSFASRRRQAPPTRCGCMKTAYFLYECVKTACFLYKLLPSRITEAFLSPQLHCLCAQCVTRSKPEQYAEVNKTITLLCRQIEYLRVVLLYLRNTSALCY